MRFGVKIPYFSFVKNKYVQYNYMRKYTEKERGNR